ncbi:MAG TPA: hypothetical protein VN924_19405 [Bryobacteraceae bacterium]|nr:hypothetical protein [Bryobacteraceae bacterium]
MFSLTPPATPAQPETALAIGAGGVLYGATVQAESYDGGIVFALTP